MDTVTLVLRDLLRTEGVREDAVLRSRVGFLAAHHPEEVGVEREGRVVELKLYGSGTSLQNVPKSLRVVPPDIGRLEKLEKLSYRNESRRTNVLQAR